MDFGMWYDRRRRPIEMTAWGLKFENYNDYKRVCADDVLTQDGQLLWVSTVWVGLDMRWQQGPPLIFETMIFKDDHAEDEYCERYCSEASARDGHSRVVRFLRSMPYAVFKQLEEEV